MCLERCEISRNEGLHTFGETKDNFEPDGDFLASRIRDLYRKTTDPLKKKESRQARNNKRLIDAFKTAKASSMDAKIARAAHRWDLFSGS